jgi:acetyl-CoA C-acetyltransferase
VPEAVIVAVARSAIGRAAKGRLSAMRADDLAAALVGDLLATTPSLPVESIDELYLGTAHQTGQQAQNIARRVAVLLGHDSMPAATVSRACASSLQTTAMAYNAIRAGTGRAYLSVGVESVSRYGKLADISDRNPAFATAHERASAEWQDPRESGDLPDIYIDMGLTAENVAASFGVTRSEQDAFSLRSQQRYAAALQDGFWERDITPITLPDGSIFSADESPRPSTTAEGLASLSPVFRADGSVTAGNACPLNDGAAAVLVMSDDYAAELDLAPLARIRSFGVSGVSPEMMGIGPVEACRRAIAAAGVQLSDLEIIEINEAFAAQVIPSCRQLGIDPEQVNTRGGAIALGHPFGMTGARMTTTLTHLLHEDDATLGLETMCVGGGMGMAMVLERL